MGITWKTVYVDPDDRFRMQVRDYNPPPPPDDKYNYLTIIRAKDLHYHLGHRLQANIWQGVRDLLHVVDYCPNSCVAWLKLTSTEVTELALVGQNLQDRGVKLYNSLLNEHRNHKGRSQVLKATWTLFNKALSAHEQTVETLRARAQQHPIRRLCAYDSLKGWCQCINK